MSTFKLKLLAVVLMVIDHIGFFLYPNIILLRIIGRLSFPIFAYLIVVGYGFTRNKWRYFMRLFIFANIIQIPGLFMSIPVNIFYTLSLGLLTIIIVEEEYDFIMKLVMLGGVFLVTDVISPDYSLYGVSLILVLHLLKDDWLKLLIALPVLSMTFYGWDNIQVYSTLALVPIYFYNYKQGPKWKVFFYTFYPVHIVFLQWYANL